MGMDGSEVGGPCRVVVVDDHELLSSALQIALAVEGKAQVVGTAATLAAGRDAVRAHQPDVILTDRLLPDGEVDQHVGSLLAVSPGSRVLLMTGWPTERSSQAALESGAHGVISKTESVGRIVEAVLRVAAGELLLPADVARRLLRPPERRGRSELSEREIEVLEALAAGVTAQAAAGRLGMSHNTLRNHVSRAMLKLGVHDRLGAVTEAMRLGLIAPARPTASPATTGRVG
jgi:two-component system, NarL family, nitrate/nitrite response regulator NarL